ncbi:hypothetical protein DC345_04950 [Paenibacillus taichungensis]|uniref:Uncharacterized protein n=1 Tax=Paenibacillus taichungensis TaxID=484184 RepID=A0A329R3A6_9BACL|nr:hypothetical protein DC345_04950 [Paenibacillus taichungensis]
MSHYRTYHSQSRSFTGSAFFIGGIEVISRRRKKIRIRPNKQPEKCKGCVWGRWDGVKQFCSRPVCPKEVKYP